VALSAIRYLAKVAEKSRANIIYLDGAAIRSPNGEMRKVRILVVENRYGTNAQQLKKLIKATRKGRYGRRDATLILSWPATTYALLRLSILRWDQIDFSKGHLHVRRLKGGIHSVHPIQADELRNLRELKREQDPESALENLHDLDIGLGTPVIFSRSDHQGVHKVWGTQLDEAGHYQSIDLQ